MTVLMSLPTLWSMMENTIEAMMKPTTNFGKRYQISHQLTLVPGVQSTLAHQYTATQKATTPISTFWIILMVAAT